MAIEPLGSVMNFQAQQAIKPQQVNMDVNSDMAIRPVEKIDPITPVVENTKEKGNASNEERRPDNEQIRKAVEQINRKNVHSQAVYGIHEGTNQVTIKIIDRDTKKVIRELPPEKTLDMITKVWELAGMLVDEHR